MPKKMEKKKEKREAKMVIGRIKINSSAKKLCRARAAIARASTLAHSKINKNELSGEHRGTTTTKKL